MKTKSLAAWVLLLGILAVPAVLFFNWWKKMQANAASDSAAASRPMPTQAAGWTPVAAQPAADPVVQPGVEVSASTGTALSGAPQPAAPAAEASSSPSPMPSAVAPEVPSQPQAFTASAPVSTQPARTGLEPVEYAPKSTRDPTLSPMDAKKLAEEALAKKLAKERIRAALDEAPRKREKPRKPPVEDRIELYGVVTTPEGTTAIINDQILKEGDDIYGAVIQRITTNAVVFKYGSRTFTKRVSK